MGYRFKRWKIKWNLKRGKFKKRKIDRKRSRKAYQNFLKHKSTYMKNLRKARIKGKKKMRRNKTRGIQKKLKAARKRFKNYLKNSLEVFCDNLLNEDTEYEAEIELDDEDVKDVLDIMQELLDDGIITDDQYRDYIDVLESDEDDEDDYDDMLMAEILKLIDYYSLQKDQEEEDLSADDNEGY
jgi:flagellar hook-basal body complex protein FliE